MSELKSLLSRLERGDEATGLLNRAGLLASDAEAGSLAVIRLVKHGHIAYSLDASVAVQGAAPRRGAPWLQARPDARIGRVADADVAVHLPVDPDEGVGLRDLLAEFARPVVVGEARVTPVRAASLAALEEPPRRHAGWRTPPSPPARLHRSRSTRRGCATSGATDSSWSRTCGRPSTTTSSCCTSSRSWTWLRTAP